MAIQLGSAYGKVTLDASGVQKAVAGARADLQSLAKVGAQVGEKLGEIGRKMTIGVTLPIIAMGAASIKFASDLNETKNKASVVFGTMGDSVLAWSKTSATAFGQSQNAALGAAATFGNLFTTMGSGEAEAAKMSMRLVELAADLRSFNNVSGGTQQVLQDLQSGLIGQSEPMYKYGVRLTEAAVKAKAMEMGLAGANGEISEQAKMLARYQLILEQTGTAQGDFANTAEGMANQTEIMKAQLADLSAQMGGNLLPMVIPLVTRLNGLLDSLNQMPAGAQKAVIGIAVFLAALGPLLRTVKNIQALRALLLTLEIPGIGAAFTALGTAISTTLIPALGGAAATIGGFAAAALPVLVVIAAIAAAILILAVVWKYNLFGIQEKTRELVLNVQAGWGLIVDGAKSIGPALQELKANIDETFKAVAWGVKGIKIAWATFQAETRKNTKAAADALRETWTGLVTDLQKLTQIWITWIQTAWSRAMTWLQQTASQAVRSIIGFFTTDWWRIGQNMIVGIIQGWSSGIGALITTVRNTLATVLAEINNVLDMGSPSRKTFQQGVLAAQGFNQGWAAAIDGEAIARKLERSVTNVSTDNRTQINQFGNGITIHEADSLIKKRLDEMYEELYYNMGGK